MLVRSLERLGSESGGLNTSNTTLGNRYLSEESTGCQVSLST
jgi:hypothetical protein